MSTVKEEMQHLQKGDLKMKLNSGSAYTFEYDGVNFMFTIIDNFCACYAEDQYQFGYELGQHGEIETPEEIMEFLIVNYDGGNIIIEE